MRVCQVPILVRKSRGEEHSACHITSFSVYLLHQSILLVQIVRGKSLLNALRLSKVPELPIPEHVVRICLQNQIVRFHALRFNISQELAELLKGFRLLTHKERMSH